MSHIKFVAVVFLLASAAVFADQCSCDGECPTASLRYAVSLLQTKFQTNVSEDGIAVADKDTQDILAAGLNINEAFLNTVAGKVPPGVRVLAIVRWNSPKQRLRHLRKVNEALGSNDASELLPAQTSENGDSEDLAAAAGSERYPGALGPAKSHGPMVALAHKQALEKASGFEEPWTLIMEEDAQPLPVANDRWLAGFNKAWNLLQTRDVAMIRLGWCEFGGSRPEVEELGDGFLLVHHIYATNPYSGQAVGGINEGVCLTAYIVKKDYIPQVLATFPVGEPVDLAWSHRLWDQEPFSSKVYSITHRDAVHMYKGWQKFDQHGLIAQRPEVVQGKAMA